MIYQKHKGGKLWRIIPDVQTENQLKFYYRGYNVEDIIKELTKAPFRFWKSVLICCSLENCLQRKNYRAFVHCWVNTVPCRRVLCVISLWKRRAGYDEYSRRSVLTLYSYDNRAERYHTAECSSSSVFSSSVCFRCYRFMAIRLTNHHHHDSASRTSASTMPETVSLAETIMHVLRPDSKYTTIRSKSC